MPNSNKIAGVKFERDMVNLLKKYLPSNRFTIIRTADSRSPVDVIILKHIGKQGTKRKGKEYFGIQCKTKKEKSK